MHSVLTEQEAVARAWDLVSRKHIRACTLRSVEIEAAPEFLPEWAVRGDVWEVVFDLDVPRGMSPATAIVIVDRETGEAAAVELT